MYSFNVIWSYSKSSFNWFLMYSSIFFALRVRCTIQRWTTASLKMDLAPSSTNWTPGGRYLLQYVPSSILHYSVPLHDLIPADRCLSNFCIYATWKVWNRIPLILYQRSKETSVWFGIFHPSKMIPLSYYEVSFILLALFPNYRNSPFSNILYKENNRFRYLYV